MCKEAFKKWYYKTKTAGVVYCIENLVTEEKYVGSTSIHLPFRWTKHKEQARNCSGRRYRLYESIREYGEENFKIYSLYECSEGEDRRKYEQKFIENIQPSLNKNRVKGTILPENKGCYKGGIDFEGIWYKTKFDLWKDRGKVPYGTFKSRFFKYKDLGQALGVYENG